MDDEYLEGEEENVYSEATREDFVDSDEISPEEEAFMKGYDEADEDERKKEKVNEDEEPAPEE